MRFWVAAVPSEGILNSNSTSGSSWAALLQPARAMVQKSEALLVTNASRVFFAAPGLALEPGAALSDLPQPAARVQRARARSQRGDNFMGE